MRETGVQEISNGRTHGLRTPKKPDISSNLLRGPLGFGPLQFLMDGDVSLIEPGKKTLGWLGYIGDEILPSYIRDYNKPLL